jgi:hypothetical protein
LEIFTPLFHKDIFVTMFRHSALLVHSLFIHFHTLLYVYSACIIAINFLFGLFVCNLQSILSVTYTSFSSSFVCVQVATPLSQHWD